MELSIPGDRLGQGGHRSAPSSVFSGVKLVVGRRPQAYNLLAWQPQQKGLFPVAQQQSCLSGHFHTPVGWGEISPAQSPETENEEGTFPSGKPSRRPGKARIKRCLF